MSDVRHICGNLANVSPAILNVNKAQRRSSAIYYNSVIPAQAGTHGKLRPSGWANGNTVSNQLVNFFNRTFADAYVGPGLRRDDGLYFAILRIADVSP